MYECLGDVHYLIMARFGAFTPTTSGSLLTYVQARDAIRPVMYNESVERSQWAKAHFFIAVNECQLLVKKRR